MGIIDKYKFERHGGVGCSNSSYRLHRMSCCGSYCVEDDELSDLYLDPNDLLKKVSLLSINGATTMACPFCGSPAFEFAEVLDAAEVPDHWKWACHEM